MCECAFEGDTRARLLLNLPETAEWKQTERNQIFYRGRDIKNSSKNNRRVINDGAMVLRNVGTAVLFIQIYYYYYYYAFVCNNFHWKHAVI